MNIPKEIEDAIKLKEQQEFCAALCADIPDMIDSQLQAITPDTDAQGPEHIHYGSEYIVQSIRNEINKRVERYGADSRLNLTDMPCAIDRPGVGVISAENKFINTADELIDLFKLVNEVKLEKRYDGPDRNHILVLKARLPEGYVASVPYVQARHLPEEVFNNDQVVVKLVKNKLGQIVDVDLLCREIPPLNSANPYGRLSADQVNLHYGYITVKIKKDTQAIQCWFPGVEKDVLYQGKPRDYVLVGQHYKKRHNTYKQGYKSHGFGAPQK
jgi:hypothetical protein